MSSLLNQLRSQREANRQMNLHREMIRREAKIGGELFGPIHPNGRREFFCLDRHTWVWHEEWVDSTGQRHVVTTRYDVRPGGIIKAQDGRNYSHVDVNEALNLYRAISLYVQRVCGELYGVSLTQA